jgi:hypothetical protein
MNDTRNKLRLSKALLALGAIAFAASLALGQGERAWQAFLLNFLFWTGIAQCGIVFAAAYQVAKGGWGDAFRRMGESLGFFLPISLVLFVAMMIFGARSIFVWARTPLEGSKGIWLSVPFVTARDLVVLSGVFAISAAYVYYSERTALFAAVFAGAVPRSKYIDRWIEGAGMPGDSERCARRTTTLAPVLLISFGLGYSLIGFDLIMSLDPAWYSTLFGWYFFVSAFYSALAVLAIAAAVFHRSWNLEHHLTSMQSHDFGRLLFGFCLLTGGLFWAQWLVFWYGDLP